MHSSRRWKRGPGRFSDYKWSNGLPYFSQTFLSLAVNLRCSNYLVVFAPSKDSTLQSQVALPVLVPTIAYPKMQRFAIMPYRGPISHSRDQCQWEIYGFDTLLHRHAMLSHDLKNNMDAMRTLSSFRTPAAWGSRSKVCGS